MISVQDDKYISIFNLLIITKHEIIDNNNNNTLIKYIFLY
jgi:hypothetical protein